MPFIPVLGGRGRDRQISVRSRPAWSTQIVPGQAPKLQRNSVSKNKKQNKTKAVLELLLHKANNFALICYFYMYMCAFIYAEMYMYRYISAYMWMGVCVHVETLV